MLKQLKGATLTIPASDIVETSAIGLGNTEPIKNFFFSFVDNSCGEKFNILFIPYTSNLGNNVSYSCLLCSYCSGNFNAVPSDATSSSTSNPGPSVANSNTIFPASDV